MTTKLWISDYGYEPALDGIAGRLSRLGVDRVDLFLLHHPVPSDFAGTIGAYKQAENARQGDRPVLTSDRLRPLTGSTPACAGA